MANSILNSGEVGNLGVKHLSESRQLIASKWEQFGFLDGLKGAMKENIAQLFENQASYMLNESTVADQSGSFETVAFPVIRRTFAKLLANELVSIQALSQPVGRLYFINPKISKRVKTVGTVGVNANGDEYSHNPMEGSFSNGADNYVIDADGRKVYDTDYVGTGKPFRQTVGSTAAKYHANALYDMYYSTEYNDEGEGLFNNTSGKILVKSTAVTKNGTANGSTPKVAITVGGFNLAGRNKLVGPIGIPADTEEFLSSLKVFANQPLFITGEEATSTIASGTPLNFRMIAQKYGQPIVDKAGNLSLELDLTASNEDGNYVSLNSTTPSALTFTAMYNVYTDMEGDAEMAEVSFDFDFVTVDVGEPKKLRASYTPEVKQDVQAFQSVDVEAELASMLSDTVSAEIDREILRDLRRGAAWMDKWDYRGYDKKILNQGIVGLTRKDFNQELITKINQISAMINKTTLRGGANWIVVSPEVSAVFNDLEYFHVTNASPEETKYSMGIEKIGSLQNRLQVYVDVYSPPSTILIGHKGDGIFHAGYIYAPYVPMMLFPTMVNPSDFRTVMGIMTRYAKKMVNNRFFGKIIVDNLPTVNVKEFLYSEV